MALPVLVARVGWMLLGAGFTLLAKSDVAKEAKELFIEGVEGMAKDYKRDQKKNEHLVRNIKAGKQK